MTGGLKTDWAPINCPLAKLYVGVRERTRALDFKGNSIFRKSFLDRTIRSKSLLLKETPCFLSSSLVGIINNSKTELKFENHKRRKKNLYYDNGLQFKKRYELASSKNYHQRNFNPLWPFTTKLLNNHVKLSRKGNTCNRYLKIRKLLSKNKFTLDGRTILCNGHQFHWNL